VVTITFDDLPRLWYPTRDVRSNDLRRSRMRFRTALGIENQTTVHENAKMRIKMVSKHASGVVRLTHRRSYNLAHRTSNSASHNCIYCIHTTVSCCIDHQSILDVHYNNLFQQWLAL